MNQDSLAIIELLHDAWDPMVSGAEMIEAPNVSYGDVAGLEEEITLVKEAVELPLRNPALFTKVGVHTQRRSSGWATRLRQDAVGQGSRQFHRSHLHPHGGQRTCSEVHRRGWPLGEGAVRVGEGEGTSIIFLDEIDAIGAKRLDGSTSGDREVQRTLMQLLAELDGFDQLDDVKIIAATNRPDILMMPCSVQVVSTASSKSACPRTKAAKPSWICISPRCPPVAWMLARWSGRPRGSPAQNWPPHVLKPA